MTEQRLIRNAIETLEGRETGLDADVLATTLAALREELAHLESVAGTTSETAERKQIAVLFAQIDGLSALIGAALPEYRAALAKRFWSAVDELVGQFGGVVDKHMGDVVMAVFGLPAAREDDVERAVRCALAIVELGSSSLDPESELVPEAWLRDRPQPLLVRVGLNTGPALVGRLGTDTASTVIGDTVNVASRLRHAGEIEGVYLSASTWRFVQRGYSAVALGAIQVRGRSNSVHAYRVEGPKSAASLGATRTIAGVSAPLVGRDEELEQMLGLVDSVLKTQRPHLLTLIGDAGIGKSRLVSELNRRVAELDLVTSQLAGRSEPRLQRVPYSLMRSISSSESPGGSRDENPGSLAGTSDFELVADDPDTQETGLLDRLLARCQGCDLVLLTLEDVHWADRESLNIIEQLLHEAGTLPLMVVAVTRPILFDRLPEWGRSERQDNAHASHRLLLRPLSPKDTATLVEQILQRVPALPPELVALIVRSAGGNPYYVEELITVLIDDGIIQTGEADWTVHRLALARLRVPDTLTGVVQARLDRLPDNERQLLQQASIVGDEFWEAAVREVNRAGRFPVSEQEIFVTLQRLVERELILPAPASALPGQNAYVFSHAVLREVTYETVLLRDRQPYHLAAARWLEAQVAGRLSEFAAPIAEQYAAARQTAQAATLYELAASRARQEEQPARVIQYERRALEMLSGLPQFIERRMLILGRLGTALQEQGYVAEAREAFETQLLAAEEDGNLLLQTQANLSLAFLAHLMGDDRTKRDRAEAAAKLATLTGAESEKEQAMGLLAGESA